jgi:proteasome lid subunit RPN8/RPN11
MFAGLVDAARRWMKSWRATWLEGAMPARSAAKFPAPETPTRYRPLENLVLTDGVSRTLFDEYAQHRAGERGHEETGWLLMGYRREKEALALATLPAGVQAEAGVAHVRFNSAAQAFATRILYRQDPRLRIVGVVHTHPGTLRRPSSGDLEGDREWVEQLRGGEGVFGIGTADGEVNGWPPDVATQPKPHVQRLGGLQFTWYALAAGDRRYRRMPVRLTIGPDLAQPLHPAWLTIERHAERLDRLCRQLARVAFEVVPGDTGAELHVVVPLGDEGTLRVAIREDQVEYGLVRKDEWLVSDCCEPCVDRGVFLMLAELARTD